MLTLIEGIHPITETDKFDLVMLGTNIYGEFPNGFQRDIGDKYPFVEEAHIAQPYGDLRRLGTRLTVRKEGFPMFTLLYICSKVGNKRNAIDMEAFGRSLRTANNEFRGLRVLSPVIGASRWDGNCDKAEMIEFIRENTPDLNLFIFKPLKDRKFFNQNHII